MLKVREGMRLLVLIGVGVHVRVRVHPSMGPDREVPWGGRSNPVGWLRQAGEIHRWDPKHELQGAVPSS